MFYQKPLISVIVPIYNVEKFLKKCLKSIEEQTYKNLEVILVNDGSQDSSGEIAKEFASYRKNFLFLDKENQGVSSARNLGLEIAKGEYISFVDSDDYIFPKFIEELYEILVKNNADISCCSFSLHYERIKKNFVYFPAKYKTYVLDKRKALKKLISGNTIQGFVWNKLYKKHLFTSNNIRFENMCFEDLVASIQLFYFSKKVVVKNKALYAYTQRKGSILRTMSFKKVNDYIKAFGFIRNFLEQKEEYKFYFRSFKSYSIKIKFITRLYVTNLHFRTLNFKNFHKNLKNSSESIKYFLKKNYKPTTRIPTLKFPVLEPESRKSSNI
ncbi:MAG: glycosyltransferase [Oscillospiraceae bacterium]|jgi:glycosyltransferase involved in cell wall biosynthesis|nr:glycosyltransferase [Oscillospiraceae bacterium]